MTTQTVEISRENEIGDIGSTLRVALTDYRQSLIVDFTSRDIKKLERHGFVDAAVVDGPKAPMHATLGIHRGLMINERVADFAECKEAR